MKFSIIVPCFNQAQYLFGLLDNVANATRQEHEVIIINDGSTKARVKEMIDRLEPAAPHQTIVRIHQKNKGLASTRNVGLGKARGEFIQLLDSDDMLVAGKLDRQALVMEEGKLDIAIDEYMLADEDLCDFKPSHDVVGAYDLTVENIARQWERGMSIPIHCPLIRKKSLGRIRFGEHMRAKEDWLFWMLFFEKPKKYAFTGVVGAIYRVHQASMTRADDTRNGFQWLNAIKEASSRIPEAFDDQSKKEAIDHFNNYYIRSFYDRDREFNKHLFRPFLKLHQYRDA
jgi:glycosyltransferase involved in cell wall biosynthesis